MIDISAIVIRSYPVVSGSDDGNLAFIHRQVRDDASSVERSSSRKEIAGTSERSTLLSIEFLLSRASMPPYLRLRLRRRPCGIELRGADVVIALVDRTSFG